MNDRILAAQALKKIAKDLMASSPFKMTEVELELYHNLDKLHDILISAKEELSKYFESDESERDPSVLQMKLDALDEKIRDLPESTDGFSAMMVRADEEITAAYDAVRKGDLTAISEAKADIELLAGKIFSEYQTLRERE